MVAQFNFTRVPSTKVRTVLELFSNSPVDNTLVLIGRMAATGSTATANIPYTVENFGDATLAKTECDALFGAGSECSEMVVAAIKGIFNSDLEPKFYPVLKVIPMANASTDLAATLAANISMPMPFVAVSFPATEAARLAELRSHVEAISGEDRGLNGQFGSFAFMALDSSTGTATPIGIGAASENMLFPWLRDSSTVKANKIHEVCAGVAALCASNGIPYLPLNDLEVGAIKAPALASDFHTAGDTGTCALGLAAGLIPLMVNHRGNVCISRTVTSMRTNANTPDPAYFDQQDWAKMYAFRSVIYNLAQLPRYKRSHASDKKLRALNSEIIVKAKGFEELEMFQHVDKLAPEFVLARAPGVRTASSHRCPMNVVPGFHQKGIELVGTDKYDSFIL